MNNSTETINEAIEMDCFFEFTTKVNIAGANENGVLENLRKIFTDETMYPFHRIMICGIDFERDEITMERVDDDIYEADLVWSGYWTILGINNSDFKKDLKATLDELIPGFKELLNSISFETGEFDLVKISEPKFVDIVEV